MGYWVNVLLVTRYFFVNIGAFRGLVAFFLCHQDAKAQRNTKEENTSLNQQFTKSPNNYGLIG